MPFTRGLPMTPGLLLVAGLLAVSVSYAAPAPLDRLSSELLDIVPPTERVSGEPGEMTIQQRSCRAFPAGVRVLAFSGLITCISASPDLRRYIYFSAHQSPGGTDDASLFDEMLWRCPVVNNKTDTKRPGWMFDVEVFFVALRG